MNNDRFKFRVWDKINKKYDTMKTMYLEQNGGLCYPDDCGMTFPPEGSDFIIEQCTGLRDKNGKLIYEGDVVVRKFVFPGGHSISEKLVVCWEQERFLFDLRRISDNTTPFECLLMREEEYQIIGHIHEPKWGIEK